MIRVFEYLLNNYHRTQKRYFRNESVATGCGRVTSYLTQNGGMRSSCDVLQSTGKNVKSSIPAQWLYTHSPTKATSSDIKDLLDTYPSARSHLGYSFFKIMSLIDRVCRKMDEVSDNGGKNHRQGITAMKTCVVLDVEALQKTCRQGYALYMMNVSDRQVIAIGDLHGSYHTFWRHLMRLRVKGVLTSLRRLTLHPRVTLLITGDVTDRGMYALDILILIMRLIDNNPPGSVVLLRGNHEDWKLHMNYGFYEELKVKFLDQNISEEELSRLQATFPGYENLTPNDCDNMKKSTSWHLLFYFQRLWMSCPCAALLENDAGTRIWFSHGGIPRYPLQILGRKISLHESDVEASLWNDFHVASSRSDGKGRQRVYPEEMRRFMQKNKISFIVRGHQDSYSNSYLFTSHTVDDFNVSGSRFDLPGVYGQREGLIEVSRSICSDGPIATVKVADSRWLSDPPVRWLTPEGEVDVYPVIVISTCTDYGRLHIKDSFIQIDL